MKFGDDGKHGVCSLPESFFPVTKDDTCHYLNDEKPTCKQCSHFKNDFACMTATADDTVCCGYHDKLEDELFQIFVEWLQHGKYSRQKIENFCVEFEQTDIFKFITQHSKQ